MARYHYCVHVAPVADTGAPDVSLWVGVTLNHRDDPENPNAIRKDSELGRAAIVRAVELCPALAGCTLVLDGCVGGTEIPDEPKTYEVQVSVNVEFTVQVVAKSPAEAKRKAKERAYREYLTAEPDELNATALCATET